VSVVIASVLDFILHIPHVVDECALPSVLPSLSLTDDVLYTEEETNASVSSGRGRGILDLYGFRFPTSL
jgi:hypothetical protein